MLSGPGSPPFAAALLAGGQSKRMGRDKAWLDWKGCPLWEVQLEKLASLHPARLLISSREDQSIHADLAEDIFDPPGNEGPLPAISRCLERAEMPLLVLAVDMPGITAPFLEELARQGMETNCGLVFHGGHGFEPLCALYPLTVLPLLRASLEGGNLRLQAFVQGAVDAGLLRVNPLSKEQEALFFNLNTPADLA